MSRQFKKAVGATVHKAGVTFRVWAPFAESVAVIGSFDNWAEHPMQSEGDGYWWTDVGEALAGQEYKFVIRNGSSTYYRNDPRALRFTTSAGNSVIASTYFDWGDDAFTPIPREQQVMYELHVGTFHRPDPAITGTFEDVTAKLDYLANLGINTIELMPITTMSMDHGWGYVADYIYSVESLYGGRHGFLEFVKAAHQRGIGVVLDVVYNHFGPDEQMQMWQFDGWSQDGKGGIYFYNDWRSATPWGDTRPDFGRQEVRQYILDNVSMWLHDCRVDSLRVDSTIFIRNTKGYNDDPATDLPEGWQLLQHITNLSKKINPGSVSIAEDVGANEYITKPVEAGGAGFTAQWEVGWPQAIRNALYSDDPAKINLDGICNELDKRYNNDAFQRVIYVDSHDSAGNGSARFNEVIAPGKAGELFARKQSLLAATLLLTAPGIPMLFQGQEFMQGGDFNDWQAVDWHNAERHKGVIQAYQHLITLRKNASGVSAGLLGQSFNLLHVDQDNKVVAYHRWDKGGSRDDTITLINFGNRHYPQYILTFPRDGRWTVRFNSTWRGYSPDFKNVSVPDVEVKDGKGTIVLPPSAALIFSQD
jgi:1,4-alpha-glucan branching enzyme